MGLKINLNPGHDVRLGYLNLDKNPINNSVVRGDIKNLSAVGVADNSVEEILGLNALGQIKLNEVQQAIQHWISKLAAGGTMYLQSIDSNMIGNVMVYDQTNLDQINEILYSGNVALYNLACVEAFLRNCKCEILEKGYAGVSFFIRARKV